MSQGDVLTELADVPASDIGAPTPHVLASEERLTLAYYARAPNPDLTEDPVAVVEFQAAYAWTLGPPNDEAIEGHPLFAKGLRPYAAYSVEDSSWRAELVRRNEVHCRHCPERFEDLRHFIFTFHDSTFECLARGYEATIQGTALRSVLRSLVA